MNIKKNATIDIKTGFQCNNNCKFCAQGDKRNFGKTFSTEEVKQILTKNRNDFDNVVLTGGEITIRNDVVELVGFAKKCGYKLIHIQTNGRMLSYMDLCKRIVDAGANHFYISLHGSTSEVHDGLTRARGGFEQTLQGINNLIKLGQAVYTNTVVTKTNYTDMPSVARLLVGLNVSSYKFSFMDINSLIERDKELIDFMVPRYKDIKESVEEGIKIGMNSKTRCQLEAFPFCTIGENYRNYIPKKRTEDYFVREGERMQNMIKMRDEKLKNKSENCKQCKLYDVCDGPWTNYAEIFGFDEFNPI